MHILFVADPLESFKIYKDTSFSIEENRPRDRLMVAPLEWAV